MSLIHEYGKNKENKGFSEVFQGVFQELKKGLLEICLMRVILRKKLQMKLKLHYLV